ncbi:3-methyladenine DNA glycosylase [Nitzschia inconspicua]|uniref:3-methyladenine DNA glycosylase n=1 Tax=Nitzschia inconspicua TaxID=303405 RepID=A0A9K3LZ35_9STRA|nr:3-methyladenine DNA glycosylase [Nitzschia inconspicua]
MRLSHLLAALGRPVWLHHLVSFRAISKTTAAFVRPISLATKLPYSVIPPPTFGAFSYLDIFNCKYISNVLVSTASMSTKTRPTRAGAKRTFTTDEDSPPTRTTKKTKKSTNKKSSTKINDNSSTTSDGPWYTVFTKGDEQYTDYMKNEWGFEKRGDEAMFEKLSLEGAQAGLSWLTILRKREAYRTTFFNFDVDKVAAMTSQDVQDILATPNSVYTRNVVVKHRGKVEAVINNAKCIQQLRQEAKDSVKKRLDRSENFHGVFDEYLWSFVDNRPIVNGYWDGKNLSDCPSTSQESDAMSKALRKKGFKFVGATTCYSMMQAIGMVIDHPVDSPEYIEALKRLEQRPMGYQMRQDEKNSDP